MIAREDHGQVSFVWDSHERVSDPHEHGGEGQAAIKLKKRLIQSLNQFILAQIVDFEELNS